jgi:N-acetylmuramoyl-L-alanine amidase
MLSIQDHLLQGDQVTQRQTPNRGGPLVPQYLVMHYTAGSSARSSADWLCNPAAKASAHLVLGRAGEIFQLAPFNVVTWHAGISHWAGLTGMNHFSIGIEMDNAGILRKVGDRYASSFGRFYPDDEVVVARHKHGTVEQAWHAYTEPQIARAFELAELLVTHYGLKDVLGHEDIARGRKSDPGPAFPMASLAARLAGRQDDDFPRYVVTASRLNIRSGPDAAAAPVAPALKLGTEVALLEAGERWSRVEVVGHGDIEGWVFNAYLQPAPPARARRRGAATAAKRATPKPARKTPGRRR